MSKLTKPYFSIYLPMPSKRSTKVFAMKNPHKKAKHIIIELEILLTFGGNNSAVTKKIRIVNGFLNGQFHENTLNALNLLSLYLYKS